METADLKKAKDKIWRMQHFYHIKDKNKKIVPFRFNHIQTLLCEDVLKRHPIKDFTVKSRQLGLSTFWLIYWLDETIFTPNTTSAVLAHKWESLNYLMEIIRLAYDTMPREFKPRLGKDSAHELNFKDIVSKIFVSLSIRSTTINNLHISEWCFCKDEEVRASLGAVPSTGNVSGESTGNGVGNDGYETYLAAKQGLNDFKVHFFPWFMDKTCVLDAKADEKIELTNDEAKLTKMAEKEYGIKITTNQILWRRAKKSEQKDMFGQEFPETENDAFASGVDRYFNTKKIYALIQEAKEYEQKTGYIERTDDYIQFEKPVKGDLYVAGADTSEGSHDYSVLKIINVTKRREAFVYRAMCGVDTFYKVCDKWGREYNKALLAVERNNHGHAVLLGLTENCRYPNLYKQENYRLGLDRDKFGWQTDSTTKPLMLDELKLAIEGDSQDDVDHFRTEITFYDLNLLYEALTVVRDGVKINAESGKYDDSVIGTAIAFQMYKLMRKHAVKSEGTNFGIYATQDREAI